MSYLIEAFAGTAETMARLKVMLPRAGVVPRAEGFAIIPWELPWDERESPEKPGSVRHYSPHLSKLSTDAAEAARLAFEAGPVAYFECVS
jgi:hypothetical protein